MKKYSQKQTLNQRFQQRLLIIFLLVCLVFATFIGTLFNLQIIQGEHYLELSLGNVLTYDRITAPRGNIYDRYGNTLVTNKSVYQVYMRKSVLRTLMQDEKRLQETASLLNISSDEIKEKYETEYATEILLRNDLSFEELAVLEEKRHLLPEITVQRGFLRHYPHGKAVGHITGHLSRITREEYERLQEEGYTPHCWIGKTGIEGQYERRLKGVDGEEIYLRRGGDSRQSWQFNPARPGDSLYLTLSLPLQKKAWDLLKEDKGSVVVLDIQSGDVLAMVSSPSFNPEAFVTRHFFRDNPDYLQREDVSMLNKAIQGRYAPGSIFKVFSGLVALEENVISTDSTIRCTGAYYFPGWRVPFPCERAHGSINIEQALQYSCNYFFYEAGRRAGIQSLSDWAELTGMDVKSRIDLPFERDSTFPTPAWKFRALGEGWFPANTLHLSIGQGYLSVTPLQMVSLFSMVAAGGTEYRPRLLKRYGTPDNDRYVSREPEQVRSINLSSENWRSLLEGMRAVVNKEGGTAYGSRSSSVEFAGKTGTAENPHGKPHAWFGGFAPATEPEIAFIVMLENKGGGGTFAAPLARELVETHFSKAE